MRTPLPPRDDLWLPNTVIQNLLHRLICILSSSHYFIAWSKVFVVFDFIICLRHQSVTPFLSGALPPKKNPGPAPGISFYPDLTLWWRGAGRINLKKMWFRCTDSPVSCGWKSGLCKIKKEICDFQILVVLASFITIKTYGRGL